MVSLTNPKSPLSSLHIFSTSTPSSSSSSSSSITTMKVKTLIQNLIFSHICHLLRALSKAKSIFIKTFKENQIMYFKQTKKKNKYRNKILFGSFRLHYNWCSSSHAHVLPIPSPILINHNTSGSDIYYDSTWNSIYATHDENHDHDHDHDQDHDQVFNGNVGNGKEDQGQLSSYLQWLEEKGSKNENLVYEVENEIDKLADKFIANCHEKFRLEKIESYRRCQELLARSL
ncbi:unnamed protein product [Amaranthus hypochondriacus]